MVEKTSRQKLARYRLKHRVLHEPRGQACDRCQEGKLGAAELSDVPRWAKTISLGALCPRTSQLAVLGFCASNPAIKMLPQCFILKFTLNL